MQIKHVNGNVELRRTDTNPPTLFVLSEEEACQLVNTAGQSALQQAVNEARAHNREAKRAKIEALKAEARRLEESLAPLPAPGPAVRVGK